MNTSKTLTCTLWLRNWLPWAKQVLSLISVEAACSSQPHPGSEEEVEESKTVYRSLLEDYLELKVHLSLDKHQVLVVVVFNQLAWVAAEGDYSDKLLLLGSELKLLLEFPNSRMPLGL